MQGADWSSLVLGAALGFVVSVAGLWFRRNWERFDHDQTRCREDLIELGRNCELARIAVQHTRTRKRVVAAGNTHDDSGNELLKSHAQAAETIYDVTSRTRRLKRGDLRAACATYVYLLQAFNWQTEGGVSPEALDDAGLKVQVLIQAAIEQVDTRRARTFAVHGSALMCPPPPYSEPMPGARS